MKVAPVGNNKNKWLFIELLLLFLAGILLYFGGIDLMILAGMLTILSPMLKNYFYCSKLLYWFSMDVVSPRSKYNPLLCGAGFIAIGVAIKINSPNTSLDKAITLDPYFYWLNALVILFAILAALLSSRGK